jgi:DNA-binding response OmpR family regulator
MRSFQAIHYRNRGSLEAQHRRVLQLDPTATVVAIDLSEPNAHGDDWILASARELRFGLRTRNTRNAEAFEKHVEKLYRNIFTPLELRLFSELLRARGKPVRRDVLLRRCWNRLDGNFTRLEAMVYRMRKKLREITHVNIVMESNVGYRLAVRPRQLRLVSP